MVIKRSDKPYVDKTFILILIVVLLLLIIELLLINDINHNNNFEKIEPEFTGNLNQLYPAFFDPAYKNIPENNPNNNNLYEECMNEHDCKILYPDNDLLCLVETKQCVECVIDSDCDDFILLNKKLETCNEIYHKCVVCNDDSDCQKQSVNNFCVDLDCVMCRKDIDCLKFKKTICDDNFCL